MKTLSIELKFINGEQRVFLNGEDVSVQIREHKVSQAASEVSQINAVRRFLFDLQRKIAALNSVIMDGRDIGTVILPKADLKIYLTASAEERALRRHRELFEHGQKVEFETVLNDIVKRDRNDELRKQAPLKPAPDAVMLDTTGMSFSDSLSLLKSVIKERLGDVI